MKSWVLLRRNETVLLLVGLLLVSAAGFNLLRFKLFQNFATLPIQTGSAKLPPSAVQAPAFRSMLSTVLSTLPASVHVAGKLEVPRLGLSVLIVDGDEKDGLSVAAVHVAGTSPLGGMGNTVIAGHRDTAFWPLRNLKIGDQLRLRVQKHVYKYRTESMQVVEPNNISVLGSDEGQMLTLLTCYPFRYVGSAPKRFVVRAKLVAN